MEGCRLAANDLACRRGDRVLFRGLSFALNAGEALQVVGPNGTGKSSLLRIVAGLLRPFAGGVAREGVIGLVDERPALEEHFPLGKALAFWARIDGVGQFPSPLAGEGGAPSGAEGEGSAAPAAAHAADPSPNPLPQGERAHDRYALGLGELLDVPVQYLSTGQRKRAALARLLGQHAAIWLLDEPLNGLDTDAARACEALVAEHCARGGIALVASHQPFALTEMKRLHLADFTPPLQERGRGWGMSASDVYADSPHPNPSLGSEADPKGPRDGL